MSRPNVTDRTVDGLMFARACVLDQRSASRNRGDHSWEERYTAALDAIDEIKRAHGKSKRRNA